MAGGAARWACRARDSSHGRARQPGEREPALQPVDLRLGGDPRGGRVSRARHRRAGRTGCVALDRRGVVRDGLRRLSLRRGLPGSPPFPSLADVGYLAFYPAMYIGIGLLLRDRVSRFGPSLWLDGLTAATAAAAVGAAVLVRVVAESTHGSSLVVITNLAYPVGDLLLLALVVFVFSVSGWRPGRAWALIGAGLLVAALGDSAFLYETATNSYIEGTLLDLSWPLGARAPRARVLAGPGPEAEGRARAADSARHSDRLRADGSRRAPRRRGRLGSSERGLARGPDDRARSREDGADVPGEQRAAREEPRRGSHRFVDGSREPAQPAQRPDGGARAPTRRRAASSRALRPQRLQAVQRLVRPSGRRRAARPARREARGSGRTTRTGIPHGRRRVLRPVPRVGGATRRRRRRADRVRHELRRHELVGSVTLPAEATTVSDALQRR